VPPSAALTLTGERTLPGIDVENYWFRRHEAAYVAIAPFCRGARILEAGLGEGYGGALLHRLGARSVVGVELDAPAAAHAAARYRSVAVLRADLQHLSFADESFDVVVSSQVIEHLADQHRFVAECARVLRPAGTLVVTTPNRLTFSPGLSSPVNPFHTRELSPDELGSLLAPSFDVARMLGVGHGRRLRRWERRRGSVVDAQLTSTPDDWSPGLGALVRSITAGDFTVSATGVDSSLDLLAVAIRRPHA
jgi:SAM-dependent methyltransferase